MAVTQTFNVHLVPDAIKPKAYVSQYDKQLRQLVFNLINVNDYYTIPSGTLVSFIGSKPDRTSFSYACTWSGHTVTVNVTDQMTAVPGIVNAQLRFTNSSGSQIISSINVEIAVEESPINGLTASYNDFVSVADTLNGARSDAVLAQSYARTAQEAANNARTITNSAVASVTSARDSAVTAVNNAKTSATTAVNNASTVAVSNVNSAKSTAISEINTAKTNATTAISNASSTGVSNVNTAKTNALSAIETAKDAAIDDIDSERDDALSRVQNSTDGLTRIADYNIARVNTASTTAVNTINSTSTTARNDVNTTAAEAISSIERAAAAASADYQTVLTELQEYAEEPTAVLYEYLAQPEALRITALRANFAVEDPNSVVYVYDNGTNTLTFTASNS